MALNWPRTDVIDTSSQAQTKSGKLALGGEIEIDGALNHDGALAGFYGAAPAGQAAAKSDLADNTGGANGDDLDALAAVGVDLVLAAAQADVNARLVTLNNSIHRIADRLNHALDTLRDRGLIGP